MMVEDFDPLSLLDKFKASMRAAAASVSLVTSTDAQGNYHGMAVTSWASLSMDPPSMVVAVNRSASVHAIIVASRRFCLNLMADKHSEILERFSRSDMRDSRFVPDHWRRGPHGLPVLREALASQICTVEASHDYGTHTIFIGRLEGVFLRATNTKEAAPLIWINGSKATLAAQFASS